MAKGGEGRGHSVNIYRNRAHDKEGDSSAGQMDTKARAAESNDTSRSYITIRGPFFGPDPENTGVRGGPHASHCPIPFARNPPLRFLIPANNVSCNLSSHLYQPNKIYIFLRYTDKYVKFVKNRFPTIILSLRSRKQTFSSIFFIPGLFWKKMIKVMKERSWRRIKEFLT